MGNSAALAILPPSELDTLFLLALGELRSPGVGLDEQSLAPARSDGQARSNWPRFGSGAFLIGRSLQRNIVGRFS